MKRISSLALIVYSLFLTTICPSAAATADHPTIMVSIKPFYNLCAAVMQTVGKPVLLLQHNASPHDYHLKPSDVKLIDSADLIIWGGPELEGYLSKPISNTAAHTDLNLATVPGLKLLPMRTSTDWEADEHEHSHADGHAHDHEHEHSVNDPHFWLDPNNAILIANAIAKRLSELDPPHAKTYAKNAADFAREIHAKEIVWRKQLATSKHKPFIVFHDAYQYFDQYFGLKGVGSISLNPEIPPSVQRVQQIQTMLNQQQVTCIFSEPQFNAKIIETLTKDSTIYVGKLDPLGQDADSGPHGYVVLMDNLVAAFSACGNMLKELRS